MAEPTLPATHRIAGITTTAELLAAGCSEDQISTLARRGDIYRVSRGVYANGPQARERLTWHGGDKLLAIAAAMAVMGPGVVVSHQSAAFLHSIDLLDDRGPVHLTATAAATWRGRPGVKLHAMAVPAGRITTFVGIPVTTPARTVVDLARTLEFRAGVVTADSALHRRLTTKDELRRVLGECPRRSGIGRARQVVEFADERAESPLESIAMVAFRDCGLPPPDLQVWLGGVSAPAGRVDFYWKQHRTIAEVDGAAKYRDDPRRVPAQLRRDQLLREDGYELVHVTWQQIIETPQAVAASIRRAFQRGVRNWELARPAVAL
jgi:predicted transcriptional regulator of viral defense system